MKYIDRDNWEEQVLIPDKSTPVLGGAPEWNSERLIDGFANVPAAILANRTRYLKNLVTQLQGTVDGQGDVFLTKGNNLSDLTDAGQARYNLGLNLVNNTPDLDKPISTATQGTIDSVQEEITTLQGNLDTLQENTEEALNGKSDTGHVHADATDTVAGFMSAEDKLKLEGIATGATNNQTNAFLLDRTNHTGVQAISTVTDLQTTLDSKLSSITSATKTQVIEGTVGTVVVSPISYNNTVSWLDLGSVAVNTAMDLSTSLNFQITITASITLDLSNPLPGRTGDITITTPSNIAISWPTKWKFLGATPSIGKAGETWVVSYKVLNSTTIYASAAKVV